MAPDTPIFSASLLAATTQDGPRAGQVYSVIRRAIIEMVLPPGSLVDERRICDELSVSRTPLREALLRLHDEALVKIVPSTGTYVATIDLETVFEGQLVRRALEMQLVRLAALRMTADGEHRLDINMERQRRYAAIADFERFYTLDDELHAVIAEIGASPRLWRLVHASKAQLDRVRRLAFPMPNHLETVLQEHSDIVASLQARDPEGASQAMAIHLERVFAAIQTLIVEKQEVFSPGATSVLETYSRLLHERPASDPA